jgi:hypothetical protein
LFFDVVIGFFFFGNTYLFRSLNFDYFFAVLINYLPTFEFSFLNIGYTFFILRKINDIPTDFNFMQLKPFNLYDRNISVDLFKQDIMDMFWRRYARQVYRYKDRLAAPNFFEYFNPFRGLYLYNLYSS